MRFKAPASIVGYVLVEAESLESAIDLCREQDPKFVGEELDIEWIDSFEVDEDGEEVEYDESEDF